MASNVRAVAFIATIGMLLLLGGCGGGGDGGNSLPTGPNVQAVTVGPGPSGSNNANLLFATVTVCSPSTSLCQTIDRVLVDTGSVGLRIMSSALSISLPQTTDTGTGHQLIECGQFASGSTWGPVKLADVRIASEIAQNIPVQIIDSSAPTFPVAASCPGPVINSITGPTGLGANGLLGIGLFREDCGTTCSAGAAPGGYYECLGSTCNSVVAPLLKQVRHPVTEFAVNNNGTIIAMPAIGGNGSSAATGALIFGIGTQGNNALGSSRIQSVDPNLGTFTTSVGSTNFTDGFIDSGSNAIFFSAAFAGISVPLCAGGTGFYCPGTPRSVTATNQTSAGATPITFQIADSNTFFAQPNLAGPAPAGTFDWGLPFFYGRSVYTAIEGQSTPAGFGPYLAY